MNKEKQLDAWDSLMVRACKMGRPSLKRFQLILSRRCGMHEKYIDKQHIAGFLLGIIEDYKLHRDLQDLIFSMSPNEVWKCGKPKGLGEDFIDNVISVSASTIRLTEVKKLPNLRSPSKFNKK